MKLGALLTPCDRVTRGAYALLDAAGYNYGIDRYRHDLKKHPERVILGTETFCADLGQHRTNRTRTSCLLLFRHIILFFNKLL